MDFKTTSTSRLPASRRRESGSSLVEMLMGVLVGSMVVAGLCSLSFFSGRSFAAMANYIELDADSRNALDVMTREIRQANNLTAATTNRLEFNDFDNTPLVYEYIAEDRTLIRIKGGETTTLLEGCDRLIFGTYQRNPVGGTYDQYPTATPATTKLIQVTWTCSREILGRTANTESVQSAKIVIRKQ